MLHFARQTRNMHMPESLPRLTFLDRTSRLNLQLENDEHFYFILFCSMILFSCTCYKIKNQKCSLSQFIISFVKYQDNLRIILAMNKYIPFIMVKLVFASLFGNIINTYDIVLNNFLYSLHEMFF